MNIKTKILILTLLVFASSSVFSLNFDVLNGATSSASQSAATIEDTVTGTGINGDQLSFINEYVSGAQEIVVRVKDPDQGNTLSQAGLMVRAGLGIGDPMFCVYVNGTKSLRIAARWYQNSPYVTTFQKSMSQASVWLKIEKTGNLNAVYFKYRKNHAWQHLDNVAFLPTGAYYAGIMSASGVGVSDAIFLYRKFSVTPITARLQNEKVETFKIFPNPATDRVNVGYDAEEINIYSLDGRAVLRAKHTNSVDISHLPKGHYYIRVDRYTSRLIKN